MEKQSVYRGKVIRELYFSNTISCAELSEKIHRSLPLTTRILDELIQEGWVEEKGYAPSTGGRRPLTYSLRKDVVYLVAVSMDQFVTRVAVMDMHNNTVSGPFRFDLPLAKNAQALSILIEKINEVVAGSGIAKSKIAGVGIGMPGFVDVRKGINHSYFENKGHSLTRLMTDKTGLPVFIENDSSLVALAELRFGAARKAKDAMILNIGWGTGLGMVLNGELYRGHNGLAGEFSHIPVFNNGKLCSCGKRGCLETESSLRVVVEKARKAVTSGTVSHMKEEDLMAGLEQASAVLIAAAQEGDQLAIRLLSEAGYNIGRGVAILIHLLNPQEIILSGRGALAGKMLLAPIQQAINEHCIPKLATHTVLETSSMGFHAELIGAAALVMVHYHHRKETVVVDATE
ncbi:Sugar kinase of the NBD/HSP70 family, may contain an N-terminal HTH domain [Cnuella takakiae]|uniref:Sugar kinase of the NBD/HSP70 family, may contain an N-terminal HTH domain n=1 Tax=Cnuella takakiae TaxID=1302690 RepID=A0A1M5CQL6_9BACT|nr:ROK family transcriptional regulator [Cnuella takakiae]OLY91907.1 sugar kinase [Cnuella takakiae]SHF56946.1 Sugar kinase of the NBD/HSP70 family, may contain an N-terminal HTH domain [Cnuella takakiae]